MSTYIEAEAWLAAHSFLLGLVLMISYDCLRLIRLLIPHNALWTGIEDFCYWIYAAIMTFSLLFRENDGTLRAYVIIFAFSGMILYDRIVSRNLFCLLKTAARWFTIKRKTGKIRKEERKHGSKPKQTEPKT